MRKSVDRCDMSKKPSRNTRILLGIACPLTLFILGWWLSAGLRVSGLFAISESAIATSAAAGFAAGIILDIVFLKKWALHFYDANISLVVALFLFWSLAVFAFFMGVPAGNLILGTFAGAYVGARLAHSGGGNDSARSMRNYSLFLAIVSGVAAVGAVAVAFVDTGTRSDLSHLFGLWNQPISFPWLVVIAATGCILFAALQYLCSRTAGRLVFRHMVENLQSADG